MLIYIINWAILLVVPITTITSVILYNKLEYVHDFFDRFYDFTDGLASFLFFGLSFASPIIVFHISDETPKVIFKVKDSSLYFLPTFVVLVFIILLISGIIVGLFCLIDKTLSIKQNKKNKFLSKNKKLKKINLV